MAASDILAVIFDFDDTLAPDSTSAFLESRGISSSEFWQERVKPLLQLGYDPTIAWLNLFLQKFGGQLGNVSNKDLRGFGGNMDSFFPGIPEVFDDLRKIVADSEVMDTSVEFYIISGGLAEVIRATPIANHFTAIYGCELAANDESDDGNLTRIKRAVTFTEKTRYIFEINKGIAQKGNGESLRSQQGC